MRQTLRLLFTFVFVSVLLVPGIVAEEREARPQPATPAGGSDACGDAKARHQERIDAINAKFAAERKAMEDEYKEWAKQPHSENESRAYHEEMDRRMRALEERERKDMDAAHRELEQACRGQSRGDQAHPEPVYGAPAMCADDGLHAEFEARMRAQIDEFQRLWDEKWKRHEERMRQAYDDWHRGNHTENETRGFESRMQAERQAFEAEREQEHRAFETRSQAEHERFFRELEKRCRAQAPEHDRAPMPADLPEELRAAFEEIELVRLECEAKVHARAEEIREEAMSGMDSPEQRSAFHAQLQPLMDECERKVRALWEEKIGDRMREAGAHERIGSWRMQPDGDNVLLQGTYMTLSGDTTTNTMYDIAVSGVVYIRHLGTEGRLEHFDMAEGEGGSTLSARGEGLHLQLSDNPAGLVRMHAKSDGAFLLTIPDAFQVAATGSGWSLTGAAQEAFLRAGPDAAAWDEGTRVLTITGEAVFMVKTGGENAVLGKVANKHREQIVAAVQDSRLGAEITIAADEDGAAKDDQLVFDAVEVTVEPDAAPNTVAVTVSSHELEEGKTFVLNVDAALLDVDGAIDVHYFDIDETTGEETPAPIARASSLADVLDATDDDTAEYWIVEDADGIQVLASVPHWSVHRIKVQSTPGEEGLLAGAPAPGLLAGLVAAFGVVAVAARRRSA